MELTLNRIIDTITGKSYVCLHNKPSLVIQFFFRLQWNTVSDQVFIQTFFHYRPFRLEKGTHCLARYDSCIATHVYDKLWWSRRREKLLKPFSPLVRHTLIL